MSHWKGVRRLLSADGGVWTLNLAIVVASVALLAGPVQDLPEVDYGVHIPWWGLALGFLAAERCVVHLHFRRSAHSFSLGDLPLVFGLLFSTPLDLVMAGLVGPIVVLLIDRRLPAIKVVFNIAQFTLATCLAVIVFHELAATVDGFGPLTWIYALIACQASAFVTVSLIGGAISISEGRLGARAFGRMLLMDLTVTTTNTSLALAGAVIVVYDPRALPLLVVPLVTVFLAYRAYATYNIRVLNLSLESTATESYKTDPLDAAVEAAWFKGIFVVSAAGNRGAGGDAVHRAPGNDPHIVTVGAVDDNGTKDLSDDAPTSWSSRGTTQDGVSKPDIYAPGAKIVSNLAPGSAYTNLCGECVTPDGEYIRAGGTSMAAPVVAGAAAIGFQLDPSMSPNRAKALLRDADRELTESIDELNLVDAARRFFGDGGRLANQDLEPNDFINPATGDIDYTRSRWSRSRWSEASDLLRSRWSRSSWSMVQDGTTDAAAVDTARSSWSRSSWSTSWTK